MSRHAITEVPRPDFYIVSIRNAEATATIPKGTPVLLNLTSAAQPTAGADGYAAGYEDGLQVVLPSSGSANRALNFAYGIALGDYLAGFNGRAQVFGVNSYALFVRATRAASTNSWSSSASASQDGGYYLSIDTVNNAFASVASAISFNISLQAIMLDSIASMAASASNTSDARTANIVPVRAFVRMM